MHHLKSTLTSAVAIGLTLFALVGLAAPSARADQYDPPVGYYDTATATSAAPLKQELHDIVAVYIFRTYDQARQALAILDADPTNANNVRLIYNGQSVSKVWDAGVTWNREHTWPRSLGVGTSGPDNSDFQMLRPCNSSVNSSRGNKPFGTLNSSYWDPDLLGGADRGEMARTMFYADVRYDGTEANTVDLTLVNGFPSTNQMGDLALLLQWHYAYPPETMERRRNHLVWNPDPAAWYDPIVNPNSFVWNQGNRNPFVDHPEYAWVIWGSGANNATLWVGGSHAGDGSSSTIVDLGRAIDPAGVTPVVVPIEKDNAHPAAYQVLLSGDADSPSAGLPLTYPFTPAPAGVSQPTVTVSVLASGPGDYSGDVIIDNAQLTSAGAGMGSADADDTISVAATILSHANGSFEDPSDIDSLQIDFGSVLQGAAAPSAPFDVHNLTGAFIAGLDLDSVSGSGDTSVLTTSLGTFSDLASGSSNAFTATLDTNVALGPYSATYTLNLSDEDIPGEAGQSLTLTLMATIAPPSPCNGDLDGDFDTDVFDFGLFITHLGDGPGATHDNGDLNGDGFVDILDFAIFAPDFGCGT